MHRLAVSLTLIVVSLFITVRAMAHDLTATHALVTLRTDGGYVVDIRAHWDALALGMPVATPADRVVEELTALSPEDFDSTLTDLKRLIQMRTHLEFDGDKQRPTVSFPDFQTERIAELPEASVLGFTARLEGRIPDGATEMTFAMSRSFTIVRATICDETSGATLQYVLTSGQRTPPLTLGAEPAAAQSVDDMRTVIGRYLVLGFEHILPKGLDHILFVLGLFLLSTKFGPLLWQVSAFTLAHTFTLALSMNGVVALPAHIVEPLIALSIAYVAIENLCTTKLSRWRPVLVFGFGLLHGLGFAGVLTELGLPKDQFVPALVGFNVGVEFGQLAVILAALALVGWARDRSWYRKAIVIPGSCAIAAMGLFWTVQRTFGL